MVFARLCPLITVVLLALCVPIDAQEVDRADPVSTSLIIINGFLVFFMQVGFLSYETGSGRAKNVRNILLKNLLDVMLAAIVWWAVGYAFAYGKSAGGTIGTNMFFYEGGSTFDKSTRPWFFSWTFCIAACTIISGCLAERTALAAYPVATLLISGLVHPLLVHWIWSPQGWMGHFSECQVLDFAGGMVVHMLGGLFGLVGAWKCGPRLGRFEIEEADEYGDGDGEGRQTMDSAADMDMAAAAAAAGSSARAWDGSAAAAAAAAAVGLGRASAADGSSSPLPSINDAWSTGGRDSSGPGSIPGLPGGARIAPSAAAAAQDDGAGFSTISSSSSSSCRHSTFQVVQPSSSSSIRDKLHSGAIVIRDKLHTVSALGAVSAAGGRSTQAGASAATHARRHRNPARCGLCRYRSKPMPGHDMAFVTLGTFMLWFGWFGFNNGSVYMYVSGNASSVQGMANVVSAEVVQRTSMNTSLGGASGGLCALLVAAIFSGTYDLRICCNGVLSGLVCVTCMCGFVDPWAAVVCSGIAGALYTGLSHMLLRIGIDDPLDSSVVHLGNGLLGSIMLGFVAKPEHVGALTGSPCGGLFYSSTGWLQIGLQCMGVLVVILFAGGAAWIMFALLDRYGLLRVDQVAELAGIDNMDHGGPAYPEFTSGACVSTGGAQNVASAGRRLQ